MSASRIRGHTASEALASGRAGGRLGLRESHLWLRVGSLYVKAKGGRQVASSVAAKKIPPVDAYVAGFQAGA